MASQSDTAKVREYAETCMSIMSVEAASGAKWERQLAQWVEDLNAVEPPPELHLFHLNLTTQYSALLEAGGPNSETQAAYVHWLEIVTMLDEQVMEILLDTDCVTELDLAVAVTQFEARARMDARHFLARPLTIQEYADHCNDIERTVPVMDNLDGLLTHFILEWRKLLPPPELEQYHEYVQEVYLYWKENGMDGPTSGSVLLAANEVKGFSPETYAILVNSGCIRGER